MTSKKSLNTSIRLNEEELRTLEEMGKFLGITGTTTILKQCIPWAKQRLDMFLAEFSEVVQPLKKSKIDSLITTMHITAAQQKRLKARKKH